MSKDGELNDVIINNLPEKFKSRALDYARKSAHLMDMEDHELVDRELSASFSFEKTVEGRHYWQLVTESFSNAGEFDPKATLEALGENKVGLTLTMEAVQLMLSEENKSIVSEVLEEVHQKDTDFKRACRLMLGVITSGMPKDKGGDDIKSLYQTVNGIALFLTDMNAEVFGFQDLKVMNKNYKIELNEEDAQYLRSLTDLPKFKENGGRVDLDKLLSDLISSDMNDSKFDSIHEILGAKTPKVLIGVPTASTGKEAFGVLSKNELEELRALVSSW